MVINIQKKLFLSVLVINLLVTFQICSFSKTNESDKQPQGYASSPIKTAFGIVFTDERHSTVYLSNNGATEKLFSAPGCGRYLAVSADGGKLGFKLIDAATDLQAPAVFDLKTKSITKLEEFSKQAGQVSFANDGTIAYALGASVVLVKNGQKTSIDLGVFSNRTPISPDGSQIIYKDNKDQLWSLNLQTLAKTIITDKKDGYANAVWSPDGKSIAYTTNGIKVYAANVNENKTYYIGEGQEPAWSNDSKQIAFYKKEIDFQNAKLLNSDIYIAGSKGESVSKLTNTSDVFEMEPSFDSKTNSIIYQTYDKREIRSISLSNGVAKAVAGSSVLATISPLKVEFFAKEKAQLKTASDVKLPDYVHIHQVLDTRDAGSWASQGRGYSCCGATSCVQAVASFGLIPKMPFTTYGHTSDYGLYISDAYTYNNYTFQGYSSWPTGAHGYMWNNGDPYANATSFLKRHGVASTKNDNVAFSDVTSELALNFPYIVCSTKLTDAHIVMIVGQYGADHTVYVNDPYGDKNAGNYGGILNGKNAIYDWSDANTGHEQICPVPWAITAHCNPLAAPTISSIWPANSSDSIKTIDTIAVTFSIAMDTASVMKAVSITPAIKGKYFWDDEGTLLKFKPTDSFAKLTTYTVKIDSVAKNIFGKTLGVITTASFKTRSRDRLKIDLTYPAAGQTDISSTVQVKVQFDAAVTLAGISGKVGFYDAANKSQSVTKISITSQNGKGYLTFEPAKTLSPNAQYCLKLNGKLYDVDGIQLYDTVTVYFTTEGTVKQSGSVLDDLSALGSWAVQKLTASTGIDTGKTTLALSTAEKVSGTTSAEVKYTFTGSNGALRITSPALSIADASSSAGFGVWVFGDNSLNLLQYNFKADDKDVVVPISVIDWTGWKLKFIPLSAITAISAKGLTAATTFTGISIKQTTTGTASGDIYFDDVQNNVTVTSVENGNTGAKVTDYSLSQNYPNPFNPSTSIQFEIKAASKVSLKIYDVLGREVSVLVNEDKAPGRYTVNFNKPLSSGVYYYTLKAGSYTATKKMIIMK